MAFARDFTRCSTRAFTGGFDRALQWPLLETSLGVLLGASLRPLVGLCKATRASL